MNQPIGYIVIPDIHGCYDELTQMLDLIDKRKLLNERKLVFLGDYINRGPKIPQTLDLCIQLKSEGHIFLMGNHEYDFLRTLNFKDHQATADHWITRYQQGMVAQYLNDKRIYFEPEEVVPLLDQLSKEIPQSHVAFLKSCDTFFESDNLLCIHAGVMPGCEWSVQKRRLEMVIPSINTIPAQLENTMFALNEDSFEHFTLVTGHVSMRSESDHIRPQRIRLCGGVENKFKARLHAWVSDTGELLTIHRTI